ncbi:DUF4433 domain-containing protein [Thermogemmatispora sp.]|uniref:DUF4433 domain-containing protein n=1 Tax=Thermogemmatispora sp. TaxID=1968838 RepID=UPI002637C051|nr:DUF4433 domain-containing protein [Thermogemmatispora sp.]
MTILQNLTSIIMLEGLWSRELLEIFGYRSVSIANEEVQSLRRRIFICERTPEGEQRRSLLSYVPFYFARQPPMLYIQYKLGRQDNILLFEVQRRIICEKGVLFSDGNAANQQLSATGDECVYIYPALKVGQQCIRRYDSGRPLGTNPHCSAIYGSPACLCLLPWDIINRPGQREDEESKRQRHAEVLVPDYLPLERVVRIAVSTPAMLQAIREEIRGLSWKAKRLLPPIEYVPELFYPVREEQER